MRVTVRNDLIIHDAPKQVLAWCYENLILKNPDYEKKERMGFWIGNTPEQLYLYERRGADLVIPFGCLQEFHKAFHAMVSYKVDISPIRAVSYRSHIKPYDYQEKAIQGIVGAKNGILVMPCGSGKTECGMEFIARVGGMALWLTHTQKLLKQSMHRAESVFGIDKSAYGTITEGKVDIGEAVTFATVQTMSKIDLAKYRDYWDIIVVDEAHHCCGSPTKVTQFYKVVNSLTARYKVGLTATPYRADKLEKAMFALLGSIVAEVKREDIKTCPIVVRQIDTGWYPDVGKVTNGDGTLNYAKFVDDMTNDKARRDMIGVEVVKRAKDGATLVLANRIAYLKWLKEYADDEQVRSVCLSGAGTSKRDRQERDKALADLNDGKLDCVFASYKLAAEGLDVPNLRYVVFATPEQFAGTIEQAVGRVGRLADGKDVGTVIDFCDDFGLCRKYSAKRRTVYRRLGAKLF